MFIGVFRSRAMPVPHDDGTVREWVGVSVDITEFAESAAERELALTRERTAWAQREDAYRRLLMSLESIPIFCPSPPRRAYYLIPTRR